jgi:hypothetical protein
MLEQNTMQFNSDTWVNDPTARLFGIYRGVVVPGSIKTTSDRRQVLCDVYLYESMPPLFGVPVMSSKGNSKNGMWHDLEDNDLVVVQFLSGNPSDPVIIGSLPVADNELQTGQKSDAPRYHLHHQGTDILIDKDGNRTITIAKDDTLIIKGAGKAIITGNVTVEVGGNATITVAGDTAVKSRNMSINVTALRVTAQTATFSGNVSVQGNMTAVHVADATGTMQQQRQDIAANQTTFAAHKHNENGAGGGITSTPI